VRVHQVHAVTAAAAPVAAELWTKAVGLSHLPACVQPVNYIHQCHYYYSVRKLIGGVGASWEEGRLLPGWTLSLCVAPAVTESPVIWRKCHSAQRTRSDHP